MRIFAHGPLEAQGLFESFAYLKEMVREKVLHGEALQRLIAALVERPLRVGPDGRVNVGGSLYKPRVKR